MPGMRRRDFITLLGGAAAAWPIAAHAQQSGKLKTVGFLGANPSFESQRVAVFVQRLRELAWIDGRNLAIEYRWAEGRNERSAEIAAEFVRLKVDVIVTVATPPTLAAKQATAVIPIVFAAVNDPVGTGLVASLARPGGNVTGLANQLSDTVGKKLELLREVCFPKIISERNGDAGQTRLGWLQRPRSVALPDLEAHPCLAPSACGPHCSTPRKKKEFAAGAPRQRPAPDPRIPDARCQSDAPHTHFATAIEARSAGRGCPSPSPGT